MFLVRVYLHNPRSWCLELLLVLKRKFCPRDHRKQDLLTENSSGACHPITHPSTHGRPHTIEHVLLPIFTMVFWLCAPVSFIQNFYPAIFKDFYLFLQQWWKDHRGREIRTLILLSAASNWIASHSLAPKSVPMSGFHEFSPTWTNTERESIHASSTLIHRPHYTRTLLQDMFNIWLLGNVFI